LPLAAKIEQERCRKERGEQRRQEAIDAASSRGRLSCGLLSILYSLARRRHPLTFAFEKLLVYQKAIGFADAICTLTRDLPRGYFFLADQLNRAALSMAANIAEGNGRFTKPDRRNFFGIARGSVQECVPLLELATRQKRLKREQHEQLKADLEEVARMLSGLITGLENRKS
jgi:four helix bundle protein